MIVSRILYECIEDYKYQLFLEILNYPQKDLLKFLDFREAVGINTKTN